MDEFSYDVRIPNDRVAVLIGSGGETKQHLEDVSDCDLYVDSQDGLVEIKGDDSLDVYQMQDVVKAIGRGFNPDVAQLLLKQDYTFHLVTIPDITGTGQNKVDRAKGRVIGKDGKTRNHLQDITGTFISVYGKTVGIIGTVERVHIVTDAIESLVDGAPHGPVYRQVEDAMNEIKQEELLA
jgi:ribosomal RNA assembly protein